MTNALAAEGWAEQATPLDGGLVRCEACGEASPASELEVHALSRVEGASDPADMAAVVAVVCPRCSTKDTLVLAYGPSASAADADVLLALPDPPPPDDEGTSA